MVIYINHLFWKAIGIRDPKVTEPILLGKAPLRTLLVGPDRPQGR